MRRHTCPHIRKGPEPDPAPTRAIAQHRHPFAGMFRAGPGRVIAVIGGKDRQISGPKPVEKAGQGGVKAFQRPRIARHIAGMAVKRIEFNEIREHQGAVFGLACQPDQMVKEIGIGLALPELSDPRIEKMSPILPIPCTMPPAAITCSGSVGAGGRWA